MKKQYWSCWFTESELIDAGATGIYPAGYKYNHFDHYVHRLSPFVTPKNQFVFEADESVTSFMMLKHDRKLATLSRNCYTKLSRGYPIYYVRHDNLVGQQLRECELDF